MQISKGYILTIVDCTLEIKYTVDYAVFGQCKVCGFVTILPHLYYRTFMYHLLS
jgi:hypothetical protein